MEVIKFHLTAAANARTTVDQLLYTESRVHRKKKLSEQRILKKRRGRVSKKKLLNGRKRLSEGEEDCSRLCTVRSKSPVDNFSSFLAFAKKKGQVITVAELRMSQETDENCTISISILLIQSSEQQQCLDQNEDEINLRI